MMSTMLMAVVAGLRSDERTGRSDFTDADRLLCQWL